MCLLSFDACVGVGCFVVIFFFKQKTSYEMRISDWSSDVCSSDLGISQRIAESPRLSARGTYRLHLRDDGRGMGADRRPCPVVRLLPAAALVDPRRAERAHPLWPARRGGADDDHLLLCRDQPDDGDGPRAGGRHPAAALLLWRPVDAEI